MKKIILHIGAGKCGSSALQEWLSHNPEQETVDGEKVSYGVLTASGSILLGTDVTELASFSVFQYAASVNLSNIKPEGFLNAFKSALHKIESDILILSCEGWINESDSVAKILSPIDQYEVEVRIYVRPPARWLNSAWWQWGAWADVDFNWWLSTAVSSTYWVKYVEAWRNIDLVNNVSVRLLSKDIVADFMAECRLKTTQREPSISNKSLHSSILRFYQQYPELRPSPHESRIDFSLSRRINLSDSGPDWVLSKVQIDDVLEKTEKYNIELLDYLDERQTVLLNNSREWWDYPPYANKTTMEAGTALISHKDNEELLFESLKALHKADLEVLMLRRKINSTISS